MVTPRIAAATGIAVAHDKRVPGDKRGKLRSGEVAKAMENAAASCFQEGITDPQMVKNRVLAARARVRGELRKRPVQWTEEELREVEEQNK